MKHILRYLVLLLIWNLITSGMHPVSGQEVVYTENHDSTDFVQASDTIQQPLCGDPVFDRDPDYTTDHYTPEQKQNAPRAKNERLPEGGVSA